MRGCVLHRGAHSRPDTAFEVYNALRLLGSRDLVHVIDPDNVRCGSASTPCGEVPVQLRPMRGAYGRKCPYLAYLTKIVSEDNTCVFRGQRAMLK